MVRVLLVVFLLVSAGCSQQALQVRPNRKAGWTDGVYKNTVDNCIIALDGALNEKTKDKSICECYATALAATYTVEELNTSDYAIRKASESTLVTCGEKDGEVIGYNARSFFHFRGPNAEDETPEAVKNTLNKVKKKPGHAPKPEAVAPMGNRPAAPVPVKPEAPKTSAKVKYTGYNRAGKDQPSESFFEKELEYPKATCLFDHTTNSLLISFIGEKASQSIRIHRFKRDQHHLSMSGEKNPDPNDPETSFTVDYTLKRDGEEDITFKPTATEGSESETQITDLKIDGSMMTGKLSIQRLLGTPTDKSAKKGESSFMDMEGTFSCAFSVKAGLPARVEGPALKDAVARPVPSPKKATDVMPK